MTARANPPICPHCGVAMRRFTLPEAGGWEADYHWACFNDDCEYFRRGWIWMFDRYGVKASYRHRIDPTTGAASPLAVWSKTAITDRIIEDDAALPHEPVDREPGPGNRKTPGTRARGGGVIRAGARRKKGPK